MTSKLAWYLEKARFFGRATMLAPDTPEWVSPDVSYEMARLAAHFAGLALDPPIGRPTD